MLPLQKVKSKKTFLENHVKKTGFMKRTELERRERELKRMAKKVEVLERKSSRARRSVGQYIDDLAALFRYDAEEIFNTLDDLNILELIERMKEDLPGKQWETVIRKAVSRTKVRQANRAVKELLTFISEEAAV
jgi:DNA relaxase NicK